MSNTSQISRFFAKPVIPVLWDVGSNSDVLALASSVIMQGGPIVDLSNAIERFAKPPLDHIRILVHIDLVAGLEANEAGLELLADMGNIDGIVTVHHQLTKAAKRLGLLSIVRMFLSDSRALERGLLVAEKSRADVIEILPAAAAVKVAYELRSCSIPHISGGLCRTEDDIREALDCGSLAVTSTRPELWKMNEKA